MKEVQKEAKVALKKMQKDMKRQADKGRKESEKWKKRDRVMLSMKDLVFKERPVKKLVDQYVGPYTIEEIVSTNTVKLRLPTSMRIHLVVNVSQIVQYKEQVEGQKKEEVKPIKVEEVKEWEVKRILNKRKIRGVERYLVQWKGFIAESDMWKREEDLENVKELVNEFKEKLGVEIRRQKIIEERWKVKLNPRADEFKRSKLPGKYTAKLLFS